ncbi:SIR2 family protein [Acinetobacter guillouiae]|uniref:SIR2 family protein n=1 Tax=Acinetobacter TaxID=469 RepID=UPI00124FFB10|nr:SIR2 family protein [Acinetobacter bereziniae]
MIKWPQELIEDVARRKTILILGAGISKNSTNKDGIRPKDWKEFLIHATEQVSNKIKTEINKQIKSGDYLTACELIKNDLGRDNFNTLIKKEFLKPQFKKSCIHEYIYNLDSRIVITPNFDKIYDVYANNISEGSTLIKSFDSIDLADCIRRPERLIIKIHGSVDTTDNIIFTRKDYSEARTKYRDFYQIIEALSLTHTFIFLGCGINDPDIRLILEDLNFKYPFSKQHYIIMPKNTVHNKIKEIVSDTMKLHFIEYDSKNFHEDLTTSIKNLVNEVESARQNIADTQSW